LVGGSSSGVGKKVETTGGVEKGGRGSPGRKGFLLSLLPLREKNDYWQRGKEKRRKIERIVPSKRKKTRVQKKREGTRRGKWTQAITATRKRPDK